MQSLTVNARTNSVRTRSAELGFHACGIVQARRLEDDAGWLKDWLDAGRHGEMGYMENHFDKRTDPALLFPGTKSVIVVLQNYYPRENLKSDSYKISRYAYGRDYHFVMKRKLKELAAFITEEASGGIARAFVDSAPVLERAWAREAGLGWIGKNTCLITPKQGSYFFIGIILTDAVLTYDDHREPDHCGGCTRCIEACPTHALDKKGLDASRCISYLTIEYRGDNLPEEFRGKMNDWVFGCDICQEVCPWNRLSEPHEEPEFEPGTALKDMDREAWHKLEEERFRKVFRQSPLKRSGYRGLKRNVRFIGSEPPE